jgi:hypothetical protein
MAAFPQDVQFPLEPSGPAVSFDAGPLRGRVYRNTGHVEIAGPDLAGNAHANAVHIAPAAVHTAGGEVLLGAVKASTAIPQGLELKQQAGTATVTTRLTFPHNGVMRYEVVDFGGSRRLRLPSPRRRRPPNTSTNSARSSIPSTRPR